MTATPTAPTVSVVMIFRDAERFIAEAIASVLAQSQPGVELLLVDDGSRDASTRIALAAADAHPEQVRYLTHPGGTNRGMSASRNLGVAHARADLIAFLDADDRWDVDHLADQVALARRHPDAGLVCAPAWRWHSWNGCGAPDAPGRMPFAGGTLVPPGAMLVASLRDGGVTVPMCGLLVRHELWHAVGGADTSFRDIYEDQVLLAKLHLAAPTVVGGSCSAWYRQHGESATARAQSEGRYDPKLPNLERWRYLDWLDGYVANARGLDDAIAAELRRALDDARTAMGNRTRVLTRLYARRVRKALRPLPTLARRVLRRPSVPPVGRVDFGSLRRTAPISREFGYDRGTPVDRHYIEGFLAAHARDIRGRVLEVGDDSYTRRFGGDRVTRADVLHVHEGNPDATVVGDLTDLSHVPDESFDCLVLTQTLHLVYDMPAAVRTMHRLLRPGGVALVTVPAISHQSIDEWGTSWYWALTARATRRLFGDVFGAGAGAVDVTAYGNVLAATAFLQGIAAEELTSAELDHVDPQYEMLVAVRARRSEGA